MMLGWRNSDALHKINSRVEMHFGFLLEEP